MHTTYFVLIPIYSIMNWIWFQIFLSLKQTADTDIDNLKNEQLSLFTAQDEYSDGEIGQGE